jgi:small subunit ribosomal protein S6e
LSAALARAKGNGTLIKGPPSLVAIHGLKWETPLAKFKLIVSDPGTGKSSVSEIEGARAQALIGRALGETMDGAPLGIAQSTLMITGGCDKNGIPMRADVHGGVKKYIVLSAGPGFKPTRHGERRRKLVRGRTITDETYQINFTLTKPVSDEKKEPAQPKPAGKPMAAKEQEKAHAKKAVKKPAKKSR